MEYLILGPLEVREAGHAIGLPGARQRAVLALLLLNADQAVSRDRMIEELWGESPPDTAVAMIQVYVSRLRKVLPSGTLMTQAPGYRLRVGPEQIDARRFERLLEDGRHAQAQGDTRGAYGLLREALELWRGPALTDFAYDAFAQPEIARLEELRLAALEARIDCDLELGRHADVVGELEALVAAQPLRERLRAQLMLALYRCGRQADALAAYRDARATLVDELGIEPSPALQRLERDILVQAPELEAIRTEPPPVEEAEAAIAPSEDAAVAAIAGPGQTRKLVTVLFAEVVVTDPAGRGDPERLQRLMQRVFDIASDVLGRHGGTLEVFAAETISAVFGVPRLHEDDAVRAVRSALELREALAGLDDLQDGRGVRLAVRSGISTGEAMTAGAAPGPGQVTGDVVTAARLLQQAAGTGEILVADRTAAAVRGSFELTGPENVPAFGRPSPVAAWRLVRALSWTRPRRVTGTRPVFVGRTAELRLLDVTLRRAVDDGEPHLVTVLGDAGVGKTTLVRTLQERLAGRGSGPRFRAGRCPAYGRGITYWPLGEILADELGVRSSDPPEVLQQRLQGREILGLTLGLEAPAGLHPVAARERLHAAWVEFVEELAAEQPTVVVVEDLHCAEDPLLDLLGDLARGVRGPLLLIVTARPELLDRRPTWGAARGNALSLVLDPLSAGDAGRLLAALVGRGLRSPLRDLVIERSGGNPFFLEEFVGALVDRGVLSRRSGGWAVEDLPEDFEVPDSVHGAVAARLELLAAPERAALQTAAVIGRVFWEAPVRRLLGAVEADLQVLEERGFVRRRPGSTLAGEREYAFRHTLTCEVARATLPTAHRARLHAAFAAWLEEVSAGRDETAALLAHHYAEAVRPEDVDLAWEGAEDEAARLRGRAVAWLRRAAELATARCAVEEAVGLLRRALALEPERAEQARIWRAIARASAVGYDGAGFYPAMERAIELMEDSGELAELWSDLALQTTIRPAMWVSEPDQARVEDAIERALQLTAGQRTPARVRALVAQACHEPSRGERSAREAAALADRLGDPQLRSEARGAEFKTAFAGGRLAAALAAAHRRLELEQAVTDPEERGFMHWDLALASLATGRVDAALEQARLHAEMVERLSPHHAVHGLGLLVMVHELAGRWEAIRTLRPAVESAVAANPASGCAFNSRTLLACALAAAHAGDEQLAGRLEDAADTFQPARYGLTCLTPRLRLAVLRGDLTVAERVLAESEEPMYFAWLDAYAAALDALAALGDGERVEAAAARLPDPGAYLEPFILRARGLVRDDDELLQRAAERFAEAGLDWHADATRRLVSAAPGTADRR